MGDTNIQERIDRLEAIAERLEQGEVDLATAKELREEADEHLEWLRSELEVESGTLVELSDEE
jgi:exonuclease VII small subunit